MIFPIAILAGAWALLTRTRRNPDFYTAKGVRHPIRNLTDYDPAKVGETGKPRERAATVAVAERPAPRPAKPAPVRFDWLDGEDRPRRPLETRKVKNGGIPQRPPNDLEVTYAYRVPSGPMQRAFAPLAEITRTTKSVARPADDTTDEMVIYMRDRPAAGSGEGFRAVPALYYGPRGKNWAYVADLKDHAEGREFLSSLADELKNHNRDHAISEEDEVHAILSDIARFKQRQSEPVADAVPVFTSYDHPTLAGPSWKPSNYYHDVWRREYPSSEPGIGSIRAVVQETTTTNSRGDRRMAFQVSLQRKRERDTAYPADWPDQLYAPTFAKATTLATETLRKNGAVLTKTADESPLVTARRERLTGQDQTRATALHARNVAKWVREMKAATRKETRAQAHTDNAWKQSQRLGQDPELRMQADAYRRAAATAANEVARAGNEASRLRVELQKTPEGRAALGLADVWVPSMPKSVPAVAAVPDAPAFTRPGGTYDTWSVGDWANVFVNGFRIGGNGPAAATMSLGTLYALSDVTVVEMSLKLGPLLDRWHTGKDKDKIVHPPLGNVDKQGGPVQRVTAALAILKAEDIARVGVAAGTASGPREVGWGAEATKAQAGARSALGKLAIHIDARLQRTWQLDDTQTAAFQAHLQERYKVMTARIDAADKEARDRGMAAQAQFHAERAAKVATLDERRVAIGRGDTEESRNALAAMRAAGTANRGPWTAAQSAKREAAIKAMLDRIEPEFREEAAELAYSVILGVQARERLLASIRVLEAMPGVETNGVFDPRRFDNPITGGFWKEIKGWEENDETKNRRFSTLRSQSYQIATKRGKDEDRAAAKAERIRAISAGASPAFASREEREAGLGNYLRAQLMEGHTATLLHLQVQDWRQITEYAAACAAPSEARPGLGPVLHGIHLKASPGSTTTLPQLFCAGADGYRLGLAKGRYSPPMYVSTEIDTILSASDLMKANRKLPKRGVMKLTGIWGSAESAAAQKMDDVRGFRVSTILTVPTPDLFVGVVEGQFPNVERVVPKGVFLNDVVCPPAPLLATANRVIGHYKAAKVSVTPMLMQGTASGLMVSAGSADATYGVALMEETLSIGSKGEDMSISVDANYLRDFLRQVGPVKYARFQGNGPLAPMLCTDAAQTPESYESGPGFRAVMVIMPMHSTKQAKGAAA